MRGFVVFRQALQLTRQSRHPPSINLHFSDVTRRAQSYSSSPFHRLLNRHSDRLSVRHLVNRGFRRHASSKTTTTAAESSSSSQASLSLTQRLRKLSREYGWSAFGVYMALTALDFPFCFLAVRWLGTDRIGEWEHAILNWIKRAIPFQIPEKWGGKSTEQRGIEVIERQAEKYDHGVKQAEAANAQGSASTVSDVRHLLHLTDLPSGIWTQLALAYAIHKSFIFIRVPLTAAITPKVVKTLRGWGWNIGKVTPKAEREARKAQIAAQTESTKATTKAREAQKIAD
jgi:N-terminal acetyltransferase 2